MDSLTAFLGRVDGGGVGEALVRGRSVGCECIQMFTKSARQWASKPYSEEEVKSFRARQAGRPTAERLVAGAGTWGGRGGRWLSRCSGGPRRCR
jgi:hypothetical protein